MTDNIQWSQKTRDMHNHHFDSTGWNDFPFRDDDIVISTYAKSGTTWMQQIIAQTLFGSDPDLEVAEMSRWIDLRVPPKEVKLPAVEAMTHRRFLKTHLPVDALVFSPKAKYLYLARDGRDVVWSMHNHHVNANQFWYDALNETPGRVGPPIEREPEDVVDYWNEWLDKDDHPFWPFWDSIRSWWAIRDLPNVMFVHYNSLKADMPGQMRQVAEFLQIDVPDDRWESIIEYCSFDWMKQNATKSVPLDGAFWDAGAQVFINRGTNGRWCELLSAEDSSRYEAMAVEQLGEECAHWLATGQLEQPN